MNEALAIALELEKITEGAVWFQRDGKHMNIWIKGPMMHQLKDNAWQELIKFKPSSPVMDKLSGQYLFKVKNVFMS